MSRCAQGGDYFKQGYSCSQAVLAAFAPSLGLERDLALQVSSGFGGGMGRMAETCGAVTGAFMVLGLKFGDATTDRQAKEPLYAKVRDFAASFRACHGSVVCRDLLGCDLSTPEGRQQARQQGLTAELCPKFVATACDILERLLA